MRRILIVLLLFAAGFSNAQEAFTIKGALYGETQASEVYLIYTDYVNNTPIDTAIVKDGKFHFSGTVESPAMHKVIINWTPEGESSEEQYWSVMDFYLENSPITFQANLDSLYTYYRKANQKPAIIAGSKTQDEYNAFNQLLKKKRLESASLDREYMEKYHLPSMKGEFNTEEGIRISKELQVVEREIRELTMEYIRSNPKSIVAYDLARIYFLGMFVELTESEIDDLVALVKKGWEGTNRYTSFLELANKARKTALNTKYQDFELLDPAGEKVKISSLLKKGEYSMLEFWASWCGPCRGEIPHLVEINKKYKDAGFNIVSISLDENDQHWKKAMKEEGMTWPQLNEPKGFYGEISQAYNILGIPFAILLDPNGRIVDFNMRGAKLDAVLRDIYKF